MSVDAMERPLEQTRAPFWGIARQMGGKDPPVVLHYKAKGQGTQNPAVAGLMLNTAPLYFLPPIR